MNLTLRLLDGDLTILRMPADAPVPAWVDPSPLPLISITRTPHELSIVCPSACVPPEIDCQPGWRVFTVEGKLDFSAVGILASILTPLAEAGINILSVSTFDTDYVLVPAVRLRAALVILRQKFTVLA